MLGALYSWFPRRRARGASGVCVTTVALWAAVACGSDGGSSGPVEGEGGEQGSGGTGPSSGASGGSDSAGGGGGAPSDGGSGGNTSTGGSGGSNTPGDFSSVWQAESTELLFFDPANPAGYESRTLDVPAKVEVPGDGREVELYIQFEGEYRITYAYYDGDSSYYRLLQPAIPSDEYYSVQTADGVHSYSIEDGKLTDSAQQVFGAAWSGFATTTYKKVDEFPPSGWPSKVVSYELGGAQ